MINTDQLRLIKTNNSIMIYHNHSVMVMIKKDKPCNNHVVVS